MRGFLLGLIVLPEVGVRFKNFLSEAFIYRPTSVFPIGYLLVSIGLCFSFVPFLDSYKFFFMEYEDQKIIYLGHASKYSPGRRLRGGYPLNVDIEGRSFSLNNSCPELVKGTSADIYVFDKSSMGIVPIPELAYVAKNGDFICKNRRVDRDGFERVRSDKRASIFLVVFIFFCYAGIIVTAWRAGPSKQSLAWIRKD